MGLSFRSSRRFIVLILTLCIFVSLCTAQVLRFETPPTDLISMVPYQSFTASDDVKIESTTSESTVSFLLRGPKSTCEVYDRLRSKKFYLSYVRYSCNMVNNNVKYTDPNEPKFVSEFRIYDLQGAYAMLKTSLEEFGIHVFQDTSMNLCNRYTASVAEGAGGSGDRDAGWFRSQGVTGTDQVVGIADSGLNTRHCLFPKSKILDYEGRDNTDGSGHGSHVASTACGSLENTAVFHPFSGVAPDANVVIYDLEDDGRNIMVPLDMSSVIYDFMDDNDVKIVSNSWGGVVDFTYSIFLRKADEAYKDHRHMLPVYAAGNEGPPEHHESFLRVLSPAVSLSSLSVGATMKSQSGLAYACDAFPSKLNCGNINAIDRTLLSEESMAHFSSVFSGGIGLRMIKPDVSLPGAYTIGAHPRGDGGCSLEPTENEDDFFLANGTSMATPAVSGLGLLIRAYASTRSELTSLLTSGQGIRAAIVHTAGRMTGYMYANEYERSGVVAARFTPDFWPNPVSGFGRAGVHNDLLEKSFSFTASVSKTESICYRVVRNMNTPMSDIRATMVYVPETLPSYSETRPHMILREHVHLYAHEMNTGGLMNANTAKRGVAHRDRANNVQQIVFSDYDGNETSWIVEVNYYTGNVSSQTFDIIISADSVEEVQCPNSAVATAIGTGNKPVMTIPTVRAESDTEYNSTIMEHSFDTTANDACTNACSGHGTCVSSGECECEPLWGGEDCSLPVVELDLKKQQRVEIDHRSATIIKLSSESELMLSGDDWILEMEEMDDIEDMSHPLDETDFLIERNQKSPATLLEVMEPCISGIDSINGGVRYLFATGIAKPECEVVLTNADSQWDGVYSLTAVPANESACINVDCNSHGTCVGGVCHCDIGYNSEENCATESDDGNGAFRLVPSRSLYTSVAALVTLILVLHLW